MSEPKDHKLKRFYGPWRDARLVRTKEALALSKFWEELIYYIV
jgi:hypothetical protein